MADGNGLEAEFHALIGTTGCGKTYELKKRLKKLKPRRTLIWSPKERIDNYAAFYPKSIVVTTASEVLHILRQAGKTGGFHIVFKSTLNQKKDTELFNVVCKGLMWAGNVVLVAEELHTVTTASHACDGWRHICFMGRGFGLHVFGLSQRPASVDKAFMASLSSVWVGRLEELSDQKVMAGKLKVPLEEVTALIGYGSIFRNNINGEIIRK